MMPPPSRSTLFPYTTLFRSERPAEVVGALQGILHVFLAEHRLADLQPFFECLLVHDVSSCVRSPHGAQRDRKSTRLNSSHTVISYAVFCLKKKKAKKQITDE